MPKVKVARKKRTTVADMRGEMLEQAADFEAQIGRLEAKIESQKKSLKKVRAELRDYKKTFN